MYVHQLKIHPNAQLMKRAVRVDPDLKEEVPTDAVGWDIFAPEDGFLDPLTRKLIPLGFAAEFAVGHIGKFFDRSGMGNKGMPHFGGVVDPDYRGEWKLILYNRTHETFHWKAGDRLVQVVFWKVEVDFVPQWVSKLSLTSRGEGGLGSTGR
jgi:dUTP pyrophosphatase